MNRIILIGNGFDLAHGLPTSYNQFISAFWEKTIQEIRKENSSSFDNPYISLSVSGNYVHRLISNLSKNSKQGILDGINSYRKSYHTKPSISFKIKSEFFNEICSHLDDCKWVDIENCYYGLLRNLTVNLSLSKNEIYEAAIKLNNELSIVESLLKKYLIDVLKKYKIAPNVIEEIKKKIFSPILLNDISYLHLKNLINSISNDIKGLYTDTATLSVYMGDNYDKFMIALRNKYSCIPFDNAYYNDQYIFTTLSEWTKLKTFKEKIDYIGSDSTRKGLFDALLIPDDTILLDFNYTNTTDNYKKSENDIIHIHGELNNPDNPMIFGYGDEIGEDYKKIEDMEENELLKNVKSIRYQDTNNYQKLIELIESDYYQVFVMGHSCGNSDRTLLNTLFEHENCLSIKPYYYQYGENAEDNNYSDIVRNISRNFRDKPAMRNKVVNKTYCEPLLDYKPESKI